MNVGLFSLKQQNAALEPELREAFQRVLQSGQFILGPEVEKFEKALADFTGAKFALGVSSGTDAILLALMALGIGPGDEVICPAYRASGRRRFSSTRPRPASTSTWPTSRGGSPRARRRSCRCISSVRRPTWTRSSSWRMRITCV
jgi:hypothetical protein